MDSTSQDIAGALEFRRRAVAIATDPDLSEDAKLFAFCLLTHIVERRRGNLTAEGGWALQVGTMMHNSGLASRDPVFFVCKVIAADKPRYEIPPESCEYSCQVIKVRGPNAGERCGKTGYAQRCVDRDPKTGEMKIASYCSAHKRPEYDAACRARHEAWVANGEPKPPNNTGGRLRRHFPNADWDKHYQWATARRMHRRTEPGRPAATPDTEQHLPPPPRFTLITGDLDADSS